MRGALDSVRRSAASFVGFLSLASLAGAACAPETVARPPAPPVNWASLEVRAAPDAGVISATDKERAITDAYTKALASPGFAELGRLLDEDVHFAFAGFKDVHGSENVIKAHETLLGALEARDVVVSRVFVTDRAQVLEWTMTGTHKTARKQVIIKGLTLLWTNNDGSISDVHLYFDEALVKAQIGAGPKGLVFTPPPQVGGGREVVEETRSPAETTNVAVVRASLGALEEKDEAAYVVAMTDDVEVATLEIPTRLHGKPESRTYLKTMHKAIGQLDTSIDNIWGIGSFVVVEYHLVGEQRGPIAWVPAQRDNLLKMFVVDVVEMRGGKIARVWRYDNPAQILSSERSP